MRARRSPVSMSRGMALVLVLLGTLWASHAPAQPTAASETYDFTVSKGLVEFGRGRYEEAVTLFRKALEVRPRDPDAMHYLGESLLRQGDYQNAERAFADLVAGQPDSAEALLGLALVQMKLRRDEQALDTLARAETVAPDNPLVYYYRGLVYHHLQAYDRSPALFARAMALSPDLTPAARYYTGVAFYELGRVEEAEREFKATIAAGDPESSLSRSAREFLRQQVAPPDEPRRWDLSLSASEQYDDNVVLLPLGTQPSPGTGISRKDDFRTTLYARGELRAVQTRTWAVGTTYGVFQSFHRKLSSFDVESHAPSVYVQRRFGPLFARVHYAFDYVKVGRAPFLIAHAVQPIVTVVEGDRLFTQLRGQYQDKDFQHGRFPTNSMRDGKNWLAGLAQYVFFAEGEGNLRLGYTFDRDLTGGGSPAAAVPGVQTNADWAYQGHRASLGLDLPAFLTIKLSGAFDYYHQRYDNPSSFSISGMTRRRDHIFFVTTSLSREIGRHLSLAFSYNYTRNQSNLSVFHYARNVYSLTLSGTF